MEKCFYSTCPLNVSSSFKIYKKQNPNVKYFIHLSPEHPIIKVTGIVSSSKIYCFCTEHYNLLLKFTELKNSKEYALGDLTIEQLNLLNDLTRFDINLKRLASPFIPKLIKTLPNQDINKTLYTLLIISNIFKEIELIKPFANNDIFTFFAEYLKNLPIKMKDLNLDMTLNYTLTVTNIGYIIYYTRDTLDDNLLVDVLENLTVMFGDIITIKKEKIDVRCHSEIIYALTTFIHQFLIRKAKRIDMSEFLIGYIIKCGNTIYEFLNANEGIQKNKQLHSSFILMLYNVLNGFLNMKFDEIDINIINEFFLQTKEYLKTKEEYKMVTECLIALDKLEEKKKIFLSKLGNAQ